MVQGIPRESYKKYPRNNPRNKEGPRNAQAITSKAPRELSKEFSENDARNKPRSNNPRFKLNDWFSSS